MVSDHGYHMPGIYYLFDFDVLEIEKNLPGMFLLTDNNLFNY